MTTDASITPDESSAKSKTRIALIALAVFAIVGVSLAFDVQGWLRSALAAIADLGPLGPILFVLLYVVATVLFLPGVILTLGAGVVFGVVAGSVYVSVAATLGATAAFLVGRYVARDWVAAKVEGNARFRAIDVAVAKEGWRIVFLTRLSPIFPFNLLNYAFGITRVSLRDYFTASWLGMIPGTIMYVYLGSLAGSLAAIGTSAEPESGLKTWAFRIGLLATIVVTVYVTRVARRALGQVIQG